MGDEIINGMAEWRQQRPKATFREIEDEVDTRLSLLRASMLSDAASADARGYAGDSGQWMSRQFTLRDKQRSNKVCRLNSHHRRYKS